MGGDVNRVALARILVEPANTLLLDEPTNHLVPSCVDMLTDALIQFPSTIAFISHDPTFLMRVSTRVVEIDEGQARDYIGNYEYYCWKRAKELEDQIPPEAKLDKKNPRKNKKPKRNNPQPSTPPMEKSRQLSRLLPLHLDETSPKASPVWKNKWLQRNKRSPLLKNKSKPETSN